VRQSEKSSFRRSKVGEQRKHPEDSSRVWRRVGSQVNSRANKIQTNYVIVFGRCFPTCPIIIFTLSWSKKK
jgi:hypothetical protein